MNIVLEKPVVTSVADADRMIRATEEAGVNLAINWPLAWYPPHRPTRRLIDEGAFRVDGAQATLSAGARCLGRRTARTIGNETAPQFQIRAMCPGQVANSSDRSSFPVLVSGGSSRNSIS